MASETEKAAREELDALVGAYVQFLTGGEFIEAVLKSAALQAYFVERQVNDPDASLLLWSSDDPENPYTSIEGACDGLIHDEGETAGVFHLARALMLPGVWISAHVNARDCWDWTEHKSEQGAIAAPSLVEAK